MFDRISKGRSRRDFIIISIGDGLNDWSGSINIIITSSSNWVRRDWGRNRGNEIRRNNIRARTNRIDCSP